MSSAPNPWILLTIRVDDDAVRFDYLDHEERRASADEAAPPSVELPLEWPELPPGFESPFGRPGPGGGPEQESGPSVPPGPVLFPAGLDDLVEDLLGRFAVGRYGPHENGPIPLPVFVRRPLAGAGPWEDWLERLLAERFEADRLQVVRLAAGEPFLRTPFRLPLDVYAVGAGGAPGVVGILESEYWYQDDEATRTHGLRLAHALEPDPDRLVDGDVVVYDEPSADGVRAAVEAIDPDRRPRLLVRLVTVADRWERPAGLWHPPEPPAGASALVVPDDDDFAPLFMRAFLLGVIHDYPLHEALKSALRELDPPAERTPRLVSDPYANQALRMVDAYEAVVDEGEPLDRDVDLRELPDLLADYEMEKDVELDPAVMDRVFEAHELWQDVGDAAEQARHLEFDFTREEFGLKPLARAAAAVERGRTARRRAETAVREAARDPELVEAVAARQERVVDIRMAQRRLENGAYVFARVHPDWPLEPDREHRLRVSVGARSEESLIVGEVETIDALLPETEDREGHELDVVVFEKDFELLSERRLKTLWLPRYGGSPEPADFMVKTPAGQGVAELRISVYYGNQHLQSFVLTAAVGEEPADWDEDRAVVVRLNMARTAKFTNMDRLKPRALAIGVNRDAGGTHTFMIKKDDAAAAPIRLPEDLLQQSTDAFREILERYTWDERGRGAGFDASLQPGAEPSERFRAAIRELATLGHDLHDGLFTHVGDEMKDRLREITDGRDLTLQVARHDIGFVFPWSIVYDYRLGNPDPGAEPWPVCMGAPLADGPDEDGDDGGRGSRRRPSGCPHNPDRDVYCIEGFWGIRHRVEQLIDPTGERRDEPDIVARDGTSEALRLAVGIPDADTDGLADTLRDSLADVLTTHGPDDDLLDILWTTERRPAMLVVLGHLEDRDRDGEPRGERILVLPEDRWPQRPPPRAVWLQPGEILQWTKDERRWDDDPTPLVMLMACGSGATRTTTLTDFATSFTTAGASAVVGTETTVFARLAGRFVREVAVDLWCDDGTTLGEAVQRFKRRLVDSGIPLPFTFTVVGNADLALQLGDD